MSGLRVVPVLGSIGFGGSYDRRNVADKLAKLKHFSPSPVWKISVFLLLSPVASLAVWKLHSWNRPSPAIRSLAVLPFESLSSDASQDYFADGMTDELISDLGQIRALRVISRTSVEGSPVWRLLLRPTRVCRSSK